MARQRALRKTAGGRGSAEAIEKRRVARQLNSILSGGSKRGAKTDGRTEKRRLRLLEELREGRNGKALKPIDVVSHINELLELGETVSSLRKQGVKAMRLDSTPEVLEIVHKTQSAYNFRAEAWKMLGINIDSKPARAAAPTRRKAAKKR